MKALTFYTACAAVVCGSLAVIAGSNGRSAEPVIVARIAPAISGCQMAGAIPDCEDVIAGRKKVVYTPVGKLDFGPSNPITRNALEPEQPGDDTIAAEERAKTMERLERDRLSYGVHVAQRAHEAAWRNYIATVERHRPYTGMGSNY